MIDFLSGAAIMYLLGIGFVLGITEPAEGNDKYASLRLGLMWPLASVMLLIAMIMDQLDEY